MDLIFGAYFSLVFLSAIISLVLGIIAWRNRTNRLANKMFAWLMFSISFWSATSLLEYFAPTLSTKLIVSNIVYFGIFGTVAFWLVFSLVYTGRRHLLTRKAALLLSIEPILYLILLWTNPWHQLIRNTVWLDNIEGFSVLVARYGIGFWIHAVYSYALLLIGTVLLIRYSIQAPGIYRKQAVVLVGGLMVPWILNALYLLGVTRFGLTSAGFTVAGMAIAWGFLRLRLLDVVPTARTAVFGSLQDAIITLDHRSRIIDLNPAAEKLIGYLQAEAIGMRIEKVFPYQSDVVGTFDKVSEIRTELAFSEYMTPEYYDLRVSPIYNRRQQLVARVVVIRDITTQKLTEKAEREERELAEALRDVAMALNSTLDAKEIFSRILVNVERVVPYDSASIMLNDGGVARIVDLRMHPFENDERNARQRPFVVAEVSTLRQMTETAKPVILPNVQQDPDWKVYPDLGWIRSYIGVPILQDEEVIGFINLDSHTADAFQLKHGARLQTFADQVSVALKNAQLFQSLAERNQELDAYAYTIAHDLNSPLALISGYAELLRALDLPETAYPYLAKIAQTSATMQEMVEQLLLLARVKDVETTAVSVDLFPLILNAKARFEDQIMEKNIQIDLQQTWQSVRGQPVWIEEVLTNLMSNAIKYIGLKNESPKIAIRSEIQGAYVCVCVEDNGLGISPQYHDTLFEIFTRYHKEEAVGTGLGLPIVQRIVTKLGGEVGFRSVVGEGSTFWFTLPLG